MVHIEYIENMCKTWFSGIVQRYNMEYKLDRYLYTWKPMNALDR